jgi:hypothetical protein
MFISYILCDKTMALVAGGGVYGLVLFFFGKCGESGFLKFWSLTELNCILCKNHKILINLGGC